MSAIQRFTRDGASKYVWAAMALAAFLALAYATTGGSRALDQERGFSRDRAVRYVDRVLDPRLERDDLSAPLTGQPAGSLAALVSRSILSDERVERVRIWSTDGRLLFSTDRSDHPGSNAGLNDAVLREASRDGPVTRSDYSDTGGADDPERSLFRTYAPLGATAVAEIDQSAEGTTAPIRYRWFRYQVLAGALLLLFLVMIGLSLRDPIEPINVGVPFAASSVPAGYSLIDDDRLHAVQEVYRLASERVKRLQEKLSESEEARRRLEGDVQRTLSKAASSEQRPAPPAPAAAAHEPPIVQVPESEVVADPSLRASPTAPARPLSLVARAEKPAPETSRREKPAVEKPKRAPRRQKAKPERRTSAPPEAASPAPAAASAPSPAPAREVARVASTPMAAPAPAAANRAAPTSTPDPELRDSKAHAAALETFIRLTESDRQPLDTTAVDQGAVRAALARTAARKKPGGERLRSHEETQEEALGGPPKGRE
jgi:hypothetical protein